MRLPARCALAALLVAPLAAPAAGEDCPCPDHVGGVGPIAPAPGWQHVVYTPDGSNDGHQVLSFFEPHGAPPPGGWPVLVRVLIAGFEAVPVPPLLPVSSELEVNALRHGVAVVLASVTPTDTGVPGNGTFEPTDSPDHATHARCETDVVHVVQFLRESAAQGSLPIDPDRIALAGRSAGAICAYWVALGPDRATEGASGQPGRPTRVAAAVFEAGATLWTAFAPATDGKHFDRLLDPNAVAATLGQADPADLDAAAVLNYGFDTPEVRALNAAQPLYLAFVGAPSSTDFEPPHEGGFLPPAALHDSWSGYALWEALRALDAGQATRSRLTVDTPVDQGEGETILPRPAFEIDALHWLLGVFDPGAAPCGFAQYDRKGGGALANNPLDLWGEGSACRGGSAAFVADVGSDSTAFFLVSAAPFGAVGPPPAGGTLLVHPGQLVLPLLAEPADATGLARLVLPIPDDPLFAGLEVWAQALTGDATVWNATNGLHVRVR